MNKDKIIKDLKEKNRKLKNQYELQEVRLCSSQHKVDELKEQIENQAEIIRKQSGKIIPENLDLHNRINKVLEYIDRMTRAIDYDDDELITWEHIIDIEKILRGDEDEESN